MQEVWQNEKMEESYMSSMDNHRRRSRRGNRMKQAAFGSMARRPCITPARFKNATFGLKDLFKLMRAANHGRKSRAVQPQAEPAAEQ